MSVTKRGLLPTPSLFHLPQNVSEDRQRARQVSIALNRERYPQVVDVALDDDPEAELPEATGAWPGASRTRKWLTRLVGALPPKEIFLSELHRRHASLDPSSSDTPHIREAWCSDRHGLEPQISTSKPDRKARSHV